MYKRQHIYILVIWDTGLLHSILLHGREVVREAGGSIHGRLIGGIVVDEMCIRDRFDRGYLSAYFVTNTEKMECEMEKPYILIIKGDTFDWLYVDFQTLNLYASEYGFKAELVKEGKHYDYLVKLSLA